MIIPTTKPILITYDANTNFAREKPQRISKKILSLQCNILYAICNFYLITIVTKWPNAEF